MKPTLLILAAGMGTRYGGLKQIDSIGPNGEIIIDYSIYDAINAGFGKIVFVIRHCFEDAGSLLTLRKQPILIRKWMPALKVLNCRKTETNPGVPDMPYSLPAI